MKSGRRGTYIWLAMLGIAVIAGAVGTAASAPAFAFGMVAIYLGLVLATMANVRLKDMQRIVPPLAAATKITPTARKATQRARNRADYNADHILTDVGLLVNEKRRDGRWDRRLAQDVTLNDGAVQPFINIYAGSEQSDRLAIIEFEMYDQSGRLQFNHRMEQYVREGANLVLCERQLPVFGNESISRSGTWDLRVRVDGSLAAIHSFAVTRPAEERPRRLEEEPAETRAPRNLSLDDDEPKTCKGVFSNV